MGIVKFDDLIPGGNKKEQGRTVNALSFDDLIPKNQSVQTTREKPFSGAGGSFDITPEEQYGAIKPTTALHEATNKVERWYNVLSNAIFGDIPFVRKALPENVLEAKPLTEAEKKAIPITKFGRDIYAFGKIGSLFGKIGELENVGNIGKFIVKTLPTIGRPGIKMISEGLQGATVGALTAGSEEPKEIGKKAAEFGAFTAGAVPAVESISLAGRGMAKALGKSNTARKLGDWLGLRLKETKVNNLVRKRYGEIQSRLIDSEDFISGLERTLTKEENKALPFIIEKTKKNTKIDSLDNLKSTIRKNKKIFIRWSKGPSTDIKQKYSVDKITGEKHLGLSAVEIDPKWSLGQLARRIKEYSFLRINDPKIKAWLYIGKKLGTDSDKYPVIKIKKAVGKLSDSLVKRLDEGLAERIEAEEKLRFAKERLKKITDPFAKDIWKEKVNKLENKLAKLKPADLPRVETVTGPSEKAASAILEKIPKERRGTVLKVAGAVRKYLDKAHKELMDDYGKDVAFIKDYVPHIWDIPKNKEKAVVNWFVTRNPHLNRRLIPTIQEGIEKFGLKPKYDNITDLLRVYDQIRIKSGANVKFVKDLNKIKDETGVPIIMRPDKAPADWPVLDHPAVRRAMGKYVGEGDKRKLIISKGPVKVNPAFYDEVNAVLENYKPGQMLRALDTINTMAKQSVLTMSLFHHNALTETGIATGIGREAMAAWNPIKIIRAFKSGKRKAFLNNIPLAKRGVRAGLNIGAISDVEGGKSLVEALKLAEKQLNGDIAKTALKVGVRKPLEFNNKFLWDYLHTTYKLTAFEKLAGDLAKKFPNVSQDLIDKEAAQFVNDTFGGQAWEILSKSPQWKMFSRFLLLSPDWVLSTMRQALSPFGVGATSKAGRALRREMGKDFWRKALVYFGGGMNLLNYNLTKAYTGKGRFMWENPPGKETYLFWGYNDDGSEKYIRWGKQFRELAELIKNPPTVAGRKISPLLRMGKSQLFPDALWQKEIAENPFWSQKGLSARGKQILKDITPYSISQQQKLKWSTPVGFVAPVSKGATLYGIRKGFKEAILSQDKKLAERYYKAAFDNGLDGDAIFRRAIADLKAEVRHENKKIAREIISKIKRMGYEKGMAKYEKMKMDGTITPDIEKEMEKILIKRSVIRRKKLKQSRR